MRSNVLLVTTAILVSCGSDGPASSGSAAADPVVVTETAFDQPLGPQRPALWSGEFDYVDVGGWDLTASGDGVFVAQVFTANVMEVQKRPRDGAAPHVWKHKLEGQLMNSAAQVLPLPNGGAIFAGYQDHVDFSSNPNKLVLQGFDANGVATWQKIVPDARGNAGSLTLLTSGGFASSLGQPENPGSLAPRATTVARFDANGVEIGRTKIPNIHLPEFDSTGSGTPEQSPGTGIPTIEVMAGTPDGGFVAAGQYTFHRNVDCAGNACGEFAVSALVARFGPSGELLWATRIGNAYATPVRYLSSVAILSDGSVFASGMTYSEVGTVPNPHTQGLAIRLSGEGTVQWAKSFPWGKAPGGSFFSGVTVIDAATAGPDGSVDVVLHPPSPKLAQCRIVGLDAGGNVVRVQPVDGVQQCDCRGMPDSLACRFFKAGAAKQTLYSYGR